MLEDSYKRQDTKKAVHILHNRLYQDGYIETSRALRQLPNDQRLWQRQNGLLPKALKELSKTFGYDIYKIIQDVEQGYAIAGNSPALVAETMQIEGFEDHPQLTYTVGLSETIKAPEFVVSGMHPEQAHELIIKVVTSLMQGGVIDLGEPLRIEGKLYLFKQFDPALQPLMPILGWYNSFVPVHACQIVWAPFPWENSLNQKLYWSLPFRYQLPSSI